VKLFIVGAVRETLWPIHLRLVACNILVYDNHGKGRFLLMQTKTIDSGPVGRPPADKPRNVTISYRIDQETADRLDAEVEAELRPGVFFSRSDVARILMFEALAVRAERRKRGK
jgi:hypothetical protein